MLVQNESGIWSPPVGSRRGPPFQSQADAVYSAIKLKVQTRSRANRQESESRLVRVPCFNPPLSTAMRSCPFWSSSSAVIPGPGHDFQPRPAPKPSSRPNAFSTLSYSPPLALALASGRAGAVRQCQPRNVVRRAVARQKAGEKHGRARSPARVFRASRTLVFS